VASTRLGVCGFFVSQRNATPARAKKKEKKSASNGHLKGRVSTHTMLLIALEIALVAVLGVLLFMKMNAKPKGNKTSLKTMVVLGSGMIISELRFRTVMS
jgi:hypothetical protein